ncbi:MAG TPA: sigma-70 family RNA polymerase sigma factor [Thermomicrobiales bacterium]|jgi:RNA polymerase sigma-70 factor (ECF subfamily)|nr:sigma-70 family RNA polymerase sigma factor [Thermomicrobiales bacterium]
MAAMPDEIRERWGPEGSAPADPVREERLVVARARRDRAAFEPLYRRYLPDIYRYCLFRLGDREMAEDATSQVFIRAMDRLGQFRDGSFRAWLFTIAHRTTIDLVRTRPAVSPLEAAAHVPSNDVPPECAAEASEEQRLLLAHLARLSDSHRQVGEFRLAGLNDREIADVLGERHTAIRTRQSRALARLRQLASESGWLASREDGP